MQRLSCLLVVVALTAAPPARADDAAEAKVHYQKATGAYAVGDYREAAAEYEAAFKLRQDPALLYNAAQSHRLAGDNPKALLLYKNLVKLYPSTKYAAEAKGRIEKLEQAIATTQSPPNTTAPVEGQAPAAGAPNPSGAATPVTAALTPAAPVPTVAPAVAAPVNPTPAATLTAAPAPAPAGERRPIYKQWWFWAGAGAVVVIGIVAIAALSSSGGAWSNLPDQRAGLLPGGGW